MMGRLKLGFVMALGIVSASCSGGGDRSAEGLADDTEGMEDAAGESGVTAHGTIAVAMSGKAGEAEEESAVQEDKNEIEMETKVKISTTMGDVTVLLYDDTPRHRDNFLKLVNEGFYDGTLFHRVINEFMVQGGDPDSKGAAKGKALGMGDPGYTIEAEFVYQRHFHKKGALAAARQGDAMNPERRSSGSQFYVVTGKAYNAGQLQQMERQLDMAARQDIFNRLATERRDTIMSLRRNRDQAGLQALQEELIALTEAEASANPTHLTDEQRTAYGTIGGAPHLDGQYTVFGEVIDGMDVIDSIQKVATDRNDRPLDDVKILKMEVIK